MILAYKLKNRLMTDDTLNLEDLLNTNNDYKSAFIEICNNKNLLESTLKGIGIKNVLNSVTATDILLNSEIGRQNIFNNIEFLSYLNLNYDTDAKKHPSFESRKFQSSSITLSKSASTTIDIPNNILLLTTYSNQSYLIKLINDKFFKIGKDLTNTSYNSPAGYRYFYFPITANIDLYITNNTSSATSTSFYTFLQY